MRLINADALFTDEQFEKYMEKILIEDGTGDVYIRPEDVADMIMDAPTIDIAEVCGECKPYEPCIYCIHEFENKFERKEP